MAEKAKSVFKQKVLFVLTRKGANVQETTMQVSRPPTIPTFIAHFVKVKV